MKFPDKCPHCGVNLDAGPIPEKDRHHYEPGARFSRVVGVETTNDRVEWFCCPDCKEELNIISDKDWKWAEDALKGQINGKRYHNRRRRQP